MARSPRSWRPSARVAGLVALVAAVVVAVVGIVVGVASPPPGVVEALWPDANPATVPDAQADATPDRDQPAASRDAGARRLPPPPEIPLPPPAEAAVPAVPPVAEPSPSADAATRGGASSLAPRPAPSGSAPVGIGVPAGTSLGAYRAGDVDLAGGTLENVVVDGDLTVYGSGTLRNVQVQGHLVLRGGDGVQLHSSAVGALSISGARNVLVSGVEVFGRAGSDGVHITSGTGQVAAVHLRDVWIHNPQVTSSSHYDGIQVRGVHGLTLERVKVDLGPWARQHNAALFLEDANGGNAGVTVVDSWLGGGGYTLYSDADDVVIERTVFAGGRWGHLYPKSWTAEIVRFEGNTDASGKALSLGADSIG